MRMVGVLARQIRLRRFQAVHKANPDQEIQVPVSGEGSDFPLLPFLEQCDQLVGGNRSIARQQFRVSGETGRC